VRRLRSRWTVVALVPAFFLAGFGIVSALAGGSDDPDPAAAQNQTTTGGEGEGVTIVGTTTGESATATAPTTSPADTPATGPTTTGSNGDNNSNNNGGGNGGGRPPAPPRGTIAIDYGQWDGMFEISSPEIVPDFGMASVNGELRYFGGVDCQIHRIVVRGWFYSASGQFIGTTLWESAMATGDGGEVTGREGLPFEAYGNVSELPESAALRFAKVEC
ncbi:MAG: hypothetical protein ACRDM2_01800, partial [Gaiellaceae bacterium]